MSAKNLKSMRKIANQNVTRSTRWATNKNDLSDTFSWSDNGNKRAKMEDNFKNTVAIANLKTEKQGHSTIWLVNIRKK